MPEVTKQQIEDALREIVIARDAAAAPLRFTADAAAASDEQSRGQFQANLPSIKGGFAGDVRKGLLEASALFGAIAKAIAQFQDIRAIEINTEQMELARAVAQKACRLRLADATGKRLDELSPTEGLVCT